MITYNDISLQRVHTVIKPINSKFKKYMAIHKDVI